MNWSFPFWSIVIGTVVTALVTYFTIRISVHEARRATEASLAAQRAETDRVLEEQRLGERADGVAELLEAIATLVQRGSFTLLIRERGGLAQFQLALAVLRRCGAPFAIDAARWAALIPDTSRTDKSTRPVPGAVGRFLWDAVHNDAYDLARRELSAWHADPELAGPNFALEIGLFEEWNNRSWHGIPHAVRAAVRRADGHGKGWERPTY